MQTATDRHRHSHWPDFAYQCNAIVVLLLLLLLDWLICSQLASLLLHPICNLQHNLCSTTEKWTYWKMTVKRRPPKQAAATAGAATAWWTYIHMYSACHLVAATYIVEAATQNVWHLGTIFLQRLCLLTRQVAALCLCPCPKVVCSSCR